MQRDREVATAREQREERRLEEFGLDDLWRRRLPDPDSWPPFWYWLLRALYVPVVVVAVLKGVWFVALALGLVLAVSLYRRHLLHRRRQRGSTRGQLW